MASGGHVRQSLVRVIELALGLSAAGVTTLGLGIFHPHATFFGPTLWHGPRDRPQVAITFDDGPHPHFTPRIARQLEEQGARGTFFCVGSAVERNPDVVRALVTAGHEIGNHSYRHNTFGDLFVAARRRLVAHAREDAPPRRAHAARRHHRPARRHADGADRPARVHRARAA